MPVAARSSASGSTCPVDQMTCESASRRVREVISALISSAASAAGLPETLAMRTVAPVAPSGPSMPKCSASVTTTSSPGRRPRPAKTMLQPWPVEVVSARFVAGTPKAAASLRFTPVRSVSNPSKISLPERPSADSRAIAACCAATVASCNGPKVPALR